MKPAEKHIEDAISCLYVAHLNEIDRNRDRAFANAEEILVGQNAIEVPGDRKRGTLSRGDLGCLPISEVLKIVVEDKDAQAKIEALRDEYERASNELNGRYDWARTALLNFHSATIALDNAMAERGFENTNIHDARALIAKLEEAGFRILGPDELDEVTLRRAAKLIGAEYSDDWRIIPKLVAAIRALSQAGEEG